MMRTHSHLRSLKRETGGEEMLRKHQGIYIYIYLYIYICMYVCSDIYIYTVQVMTKVFDRSFLFSLVSRPRGSHGFRLPHLGKHFWAHGSPPSALHPMMCSGSYTEMGCSNQILVVRMVSAVLSCSISKLHSQVAS